MIQVDSLNKRFGNIHAVKDVSLEIHPGQIFGLLGPNGAGKTTLFRMIIGEERPDEGQVSLPDGTRLAYFSQNVGEMAGKSALQEVVEGDAKVKALQEKMREYEAKLKPRAFLISVRHILKPFPIL